MSIYCGMDFHARQQTVCYFDTADREVRLQELRHDRDDIRGFYSQFTGEVVVGLEASGYSIWFVELLEGLGHHVLVGDAAEIRCRAKRRARDCRIHRSVLQPAAAASPPRVLVARGIHATVHAAAKGGVNARRGVRF